MPFPTQNLSNYYLEYEIHRSEVIRNVGLTQLIIDTYFDYGHFGSGHIIGMGGYPIPMPEESLSPSGMHFTLKAV
ncbi:hypothetical protein [Algoriphagus sp. AGSA1]|uniref:hypothetical protein n=1 Tax=Algoriphagus sp. AGSA1 TaxID=2907213 RepID=UPI001F44D8B1|nr:hypothetical protein [Algoriphagus sp. AGSA1]